MSAGFSAAVVAWAAAAAEGDSEHGVEVEVGAASWVSGTGVTVMMTTVVAAAGAAAGELAALETPVEAAASSLQGVDVAGALGTSSVASGVLAGVVVGAGVDASSSQGVEAAGTSGASGTSGTSGTSGASVGTTSDEQGVLVGSSGPMVGLGLSVLSVKAGARDGLNERDAGSVKVPEGLGWSTPVLMVVMKELISGGIDVENSGS